ncbi:MAG: S8 family serine peptidase [Chloroflexi bacterium]|nr:S8 family serine peptidase [Chloroflexota bacterium]
MAFSIGFKRVVVGIALTLLAAGGLSIHLSWPTDTPVIPTLMVLPTQPEAGAPVSTVAAAPPVVYTPVTQPTATLGVPSPEAAPILATPNTPATVPNQIVITFQASASASDKAAYVAALGGTIVQEVTALNSVVVSLPAANAALLPATSIIAASEPDYYAVALGGEVNDPLYPQQWHLPVIGTADGWAAVTSASPSVIVAIVDSGICADHPDLAGRILPGYDFVDRDGQPQDALGHGCGVAGIVAANASNGEGIAGIAPNVQVLPLRALDSRGIGTYSNVAAAIVYAADHGAAVINLSLGGTTPSELLQNAVDYAIAKGALVIAAAGNTGGAVLYPAAYAPVIAVASVDSSLQRSRFSSYGPEIDLFAPGENILTTSHDGGYQPMTGTSFAAPQAAGIAALELARGRNFIPNGGLLRFTGEGAPVEPTATLLPTTPAAPPSAPLMRNPAAVYCLDLGYRYETVPGIGGGDDGLCVFPDGDRCEQWDFYAGKCGQAYSFCARQGLNTITLNRSDNFSPAYAACADAAGHIVGTVNDLSALADRAQGCYDGVCPQTAAPASLDVPVNPAEDPVSLVPVPASLDWRNYQGGNWLTAVRNQGSCGSCWAFAAVGVLEAALKIGAINAAWSPEPNLAEQYLITSGCGADAGDCAGGWSHRALNFIRDHGITDEVCMPYQGQNSLTCSPTCSGLTRADQIGYSYWPSAQYIKQNLVARGPVVVYMHIGGTSGGYWDSGGVFRCRHDAASDGSYNIDHAVVAVGYNDAGRYWIIRNSWGAGWNGDGYFKVGYNECNIDNTFVAYARQNLPAPASLEADTTTTATTARVTFSWQGSPLQTRYNFRITTGADPSSPPLEDASTTNTYYSYTFDSPGTFYWHVRSADDSGVSSAWRTLPVQVAPGDPLDAVPARNYASTGSVRLTWSAVTWATGYEIQVDDDPAFGSPDSQRLPSGTLAADFTPTTGATYYWRVRAFSAEGAAGGWSAVDQFVVSTP